jgi:hypothetical protein
MINIIKKHFNPILWISLGAVSSLFIVCPLVIALLKYDRLNHSQPLAEVIISSYKNFLWEIDFDRVLLVSIFLAVGGLVGYLFYFLKTSLNNKEKRLSLEELLEKGECETVEFKSSLRWDYRQNKTNKELEFAVLKTIVAFMNSRKGTLMIGVTDDAAIIGLEKDYQSLKKKNRDGFEQHIMELVALNIGTDCCKNIRIYFFHREENDICAIEVCKIKIPVFLKFQGNTLFYVRTGNHTRELNIQEAIKYINQKI